MHRRAFIGIVGGALALAGRTSRAQPPGFAQSLEQPRRIAILDDGDKSAREPVWRAFRERLQELGYAEGKNLAFDRRWANSALGRLPQLARELVQAKPDVIVANTTPGARAAMQATATIPVVFVAAADPVGAGLVATLAHPGSNATGLTNLSTDAAGKRIELLRELVPGARRIGFLGPSGNQGTMAVFRGLQEAARSRNATVRLVDAGDGATIKQGFADVAAESLDGLIVGAALIAHRKQIAELAAEHRLPAVYAYREFIEAGGLVAYGPNLAGQYRRAADYVHRILQGAKPADLPVEQPSTLWLGINLRAARAIGIAIPRELLLRADEIIE